jgi:class 3 adenylate cyclase
MAEERIERRLAAILAADVAGYSRLMAADEEGTLGTLKTLRREVTDPKITEHRGREHGRFGAIPSSHLGGIGLDLMGAFTTPNAAPPDWRCTAWESDCRSLQARLP